MSKILLIAIFLSTPSEFTIGSGPVKYTSDTNLYQTFIVLSPVTTGLGPEAPNLVGCGADNGGQNVAVGLEFDTTARRAYFPGNPLGCWDSSRDLILQIVFTAEDDDPFQEGEIFNWAFDYRAIDLANGVGWESGDLVTLNATYTQAAVGAGVECAGGFVAFTFPRGGVGGHQAYSYFYAINGALRKVAGGTYSGSPFVGAGLWAIPIVEECLW